MNPRDLRCGQHVETISGSHPQEPITMLTRDRAILRDGTELPYESIAAVVEPTR